jgi:hypothetical protein
MKKQQQARSIAYAEAVEYLLDSLPGMLDAYNQEAETWNPSPVPPHVVYGSVFSNFIRKVVVEDTRHMGYSRTDIIGRSFKLIERLSRSTDLQARCLIEANVLKSLLGQESTDWERCSPLFGTHTLPMASAVAIRIGTATEPPRR